MTTTAISSLALLAAERDTDRNPLPSAESRALIAWWSEQEAIAGLLGRRPAAAGDTAAPRSAWERQRDTVGARAPFLQHQTAAIVRPLPPEFSLLAEQFRGRGDLERGERPEWVEIGSLVCIQKSVHQEPMGHSALPLQDDVVALWNYCLPPLAPATFSVERVENAVTYTSPNPNLRIAGPVQVKDWEQLNAAQLHAGSLVAEPSLRGVGEVAGFRIGLGSRLMRVLKCQGRYFLANGYHRCYQLLLGGIHHAPVLVADVHLIPPRRSNFFPREILFGPRPPFLRDFLDDSVAASIRSRRIVRKVVRVTAEEFTIYQDEGPDAPVCDGD